MNPRALHLLLAAAASLAPSPARAQHEDPRPAPASTPADRPAAGSIGAAIAAAQPGATIVVPHGLYREHLVIDKPITLTAHGAAVIDGGGSGDIIEITAPDVTIRGFIIRNTGEDLDKENAALRALAPRATIQDNTIDDILFGIDLREAPDSRIVNNRIGGKKLDIARRGDGLRLWRSDRTVVQGNTIHDGRDAILWYSSGVVVRSNTAFDCRYGFHLMFSDNVLIEDNHLSRNSVGIYLMYSSGVEIRANRLFANRGPSGYGIGLKETDRFSVRNNLIAGNRSGIYIDGSPFTAAQPGEFSGNTLARNDVGMTFLPSARGSEVVGNNFIDNIEQVAVAGRGSLDANRFWKEDRGNFWSDYTGYDQDNDGVGDFVHESSTLFESLIERRPALRLFLFSPAQQAVEFVGRALPAVRPEPKFADEVPLMRPVPVVPAPTPSPSDRPLLAAAALSFLLAGSGILFAARSTAPGRRARHANPTGGVA